MEEELRELKSVLRSLVVSSPSQVDVRTLLRDYRNMVGAPIPLAKYGYRDAVTFLKERCSDCFVFVDPRSANPVLTLIVPDTLKHIDHFVQKQRVNTSAKIKGKRRSIPGAAASPLDSRAESDTNLIVKTFNEKLSVSEKVNMTPEKQPELAPVEYVTPISRASSKTINTVSKPEPVNSVIYEESNNAAKFEGCTTNAVQNFLRKKTSLYASSHDMDELVNDGKTSSKDSGRQTSSSNSLSKGMRLEELKHEIQELLAGHPEGITCTDLIRLYRERYGRELNYSRFGYTSIISLACMLDDSVEIWRPTATGDWRLRDARAGPAPRLHRPPRPALRAHRAAPAAAQVDVDDALPGIDFDEDVFPADCLHLMESVPGPSLGALRPGAMLEVQVGEVYSPSHFWLLRLGERHHLAMEDIMDEMTEYYSRGEGRERWLALGAVREGHYCSSLYERDWHRSLIVSVLDSDTVKVRHIDYGTVETVAARSLKPLRRAWAALPAQALRARLAGVRPPAAGRRWPHAAAAGFLDLVRDRRLVANLVAVDQQDDVLEVFLIDTSSSSDVCVGSELIRAGYADARSDSSVRATDCYLFPRFEALESGATPNYAEICGYLRDGIALDYVDDYRRHVPHCLPPQPAPPPAPTPPSPSPSPPPSPVLCLPSPPSAPETPEPPAPVTKMTTACSAPTLVDRSVSPLPSPPCPASVPAPSFAPVPAPSFAPVPAPSPSPVPAPSPFFAAPETGGVMLSADECAMFRYLSRVDLNAAHWYMVGALSRGAPPLAPPPLAPPPARGPPVGALNAAAPEFQPRMFPPLLPPPPMFQSMYPMPVFGPMMPPPPPPGSPGPPRPRRPPPGFGK